MKNLVRAFTAIVLITVLQGCKHDSQNAFLDAWINEPPNAVKHDFLMHTPRRGQIDSGKPVLADAIPSSIAMLGARPYVSISAVTTRRLCGENVRIPTSKRAFLVRGFDVQCSVNEFGRDVWLSYGMLTRQSPSEVNIRHRPLVVFLDHSPKAVYVTMSFAE